MNEVIIDNFITYCNDMHIANEGFIDTIKETLRKAVLRIIQKLKQLISKCKDGKIKSILMSLLNRAEKALTKTNNMTETNKEKVQQEVQQEVTEIQEEMDKLTEELTGVNTSKERVEEHTTENYIKIDKIAGNKYTRFINIYNIKKDIMTKAKAAINTMTKTDNYEVYKSAFSELRSLFGLPSNTTIYGIHREVNKLNFYMVEEGNPIKHNEKYKLIHSTNQDNLTELKPTFRSDDGRYYASQRVYFSYDAVNRMGIKMEKDENGKYSDYTGSSVHIYTPVNSYTHICLDTDLSNSRKIGACYVHVNAPIKVRQLI